MPKSASLGLSLSHHPLRLVFYDVPDGMGNSRVNARRNTSPLAMELKTNLQARLSQSLSIISSAKTSEELMELLRSEAAVHGLLVDVTMGAHDHNTKKGQVNESFLADLSNFLAAIHKWKPKLPVILLLERGLHRILGHTYLGHVSECLFLFEDTTEHIAGRVIECLKRYWASLVPPFAGALYKYASVCEFSFAAPGHQGGVGFRKTTVGRTLYDFYDENLFRSDMGIERTQLGSLLEHTGAIGDSEQYAACVFGSHQTYSGVVGTSGSNRTLFTACLTERDIAIIDRNCHKSIEQGLIISGATPVFLVPSTNVYGVIGPIFKDQLTPEAIQKAIADSPLAARPHLCQRPVYSVITNCTYDGVCYDAVTVEELLRQTESIDFMHFDEAWFAYARFHPLYHRRFAMHGRPEDHDVTGPTVFATQSTHKLLAALSQASYIHVRNGRRAVQPSIFNEAYMMHTTTSPLYAIVASNDIATAIMDHDGYRLIAETIHEAVRFRQQLALIARKEREGGSWFFRPWNAEYVTVPPSWGSLDSAPDVAQGIDPSSGARWCKKGSRTLKLSTQLSAGVHITQSSPNLATLSDPSSSGEPDETVVAFEDAPTELLCSDPRCWELRPGDAWHGFTTLQDRGYAMLDPIKIGIITPGLTAGGHLESWGVPATLLSSYLSQNGIVVARTMEHQVLVMFSIGVTHGKWSTLLSVLHNFKVAWEENTLVRECLRDLYLAKPHTYANQGLRDLGMAMWRYMLACGSSLRGDFGVLPRAVMTPRQAQQRIRDEARKVNIEDAANMVAATSVIPYPPGIPLVMPGESFGPLEGPYLQYLLAKQAWNKQFPGFEAEIEGIEVHEGTFKLFVLAPEDPQPARATSTAAAASTGSEEAAGLTLLSSPS